ncbi:MAG: squalene--hopene cyclase [Nitrospiraceae bacterium]|nr:squalene--hopene cyclase [Nitrospiraceae bacterium]
MAKQDEALFQAMKIKNSLKNYPIATHHLKGELKPFPKAPSLAEEAESAVKKTQSYFLAVQQEEGYWQYELESNVTITAEYLMLLHFLGIKDRQRDRKIGSYLLNKQRPDGTWPIHWGGKGDLNATIEAYFALKLVGMGPDEPPLRRAREFILAEGGVGAARVFTKIFLALFGQVSWKELPSMPVEIMLLPPTFPFSIYNFSSWARSTIVPLSIILELRPVVEPPEGARIDELCAKGGRGTGRIRAGFFRRMIKKFFLLLDRTMKGFERFPLRPLKPKGLRAAKKWIIEHQEKTGDWGGIQPAMVNSIFALSALGHGVESPPVARGLKALQKFTIERDDGLVLQSCISPVWDTALTAIALVASGIPREHPALVKSCQWLASKQIEKKGDWSIKRPKLEPGGWAFEFVNNFYPDVDDSAVVLMFLNGYARTQNLDGKIGKGINWVLGMQGSDGGWGAFDVDNDKEVLNQIPFADLEAMIDPSTPDVTGRVLEMLGIAGFRLSDPRVQRAIAYIKKAQEEDGSFWGRWGVNYIYGTWSVMMGLSSIGEDLSKPYVRRAVRWIENFQNLDGGWGECCESYGDYRMKGHGPSTPSQTAWALLALIAAGEENSEEVVRGIHYLLETQNADGTWDEEEFTGTGFPKYFMIRYHNYRNCFPLLALGRFLGAKKARGRKI